MIKVPIQTVWVLVPLLCRRKYMRFKYQAPPGYKATSLAIAGQDLEVNNGVVESQDDIIQFLKPLGFERYVETVETKKSTAAAKE